MPARLNPKQDNRTREAIRTTQLVKRLQCFALDCPDDAGNAVELDAPRLKAIEILLRKTLPDLSAQDVNATFNGKVQIAGVEMTFVRPDPEASDS